MRTRGKIAHVLTNRNLIKKKKFTDLLYETMYSVKPRFVIGRAVLNIHVELSFVRKANMAPSKGKNPQRTAVFWQVRGFFCGRKGRLTIALFCCFSDAEVRKKLLENLKKEVK